jgi:hypothetical protein
MAVSLPDFNEVLTCWRGGPPGPGTIQFNTCPCQVYVESRPPNDVVPGTSNNSVQTIVIRVPRYTTFPFVPQTGDIYQMNSNTNVFYRHRWSHSCHIGFPNQYQLIHVDMIDPAGAQVLFDQNTN